MKAPSAFLAGACISATVGKVKVPTSLLSAAGLHFELAELGWLTLSFATSLAAALALALAAAVGSVAVSVVSFTLEVGILRGQVVKAILELLDL